MLSAAAATAAATIAPKEPQNVEDDFSQTMPTGVNLRLESQKIDISQFDSSNALHVQPVLDVMRYPPGSSMGKQQADGSPVKGVRSVSNESKKQE